MIYALQNVPRIIRDSGSSHRGWPVKVPMIICASKGSRLHFAEKHQCSLSVWIVCCLAGIPRVVPERTLSRRLLAAMQGGWVRSQLAVVAKGSPQITIYSGVQWQCRQLDLLRGELEYEPWKFHASLLIISTCNSKPHCIAKQY